MMISGAETRLHAPKLLTGRQMGARAGLFAPELCRVVLPGAITTVDGRLRTRHDPQQQREGTKTTTEGRYRTRRDLKRQETFAKVFRKLWQVRSEEALGGWIYRIATNEINRFFKRKRIILVSEELPEAAIAHEEVDERKAAEILIPKAIGKLTPLEREVFCLKYYEDMDYEQISHITGANKNTLMVIWHNAKKKIKEEIQKMYDIEREWGRP